MTTEQRAALAQLFGLDDDDQAIADLLRDVADWREHGTWGTLPLSFAAGVLVGVGGRNYRRVRTSGLVKLVPETRKG